MCTAEGDQIAMKQQYRLTPKVVQILIFKQLTEQNKINTTTEQVNRRDGVVVKASASQSVDLGFNPRVEPYQDFLKNGIHSFPAWRLIQKKDSVENKTASFLVVSLGKALKGTLPSLCGRQVAHPCFTGLQL